uniref:Amino acid transporter n=1 Tax=Meloidogyne floridensis TaxID=298350 RepID=A0A915NZK5_9BILA
PSIPDPNLRILRSVFIISFVIIFGWIFGAAARNPVTNLCKNIATAISIIFKDEKGNPSQTIYDIINTYSITLVTLINPISAGINSIILFTSNSEYRNAFKKAFGIKQQTNTVSIGPYFSNQRN